jgi:hypothetical protein
MLPSADRTPTSPILEHNSKYSNKRAYLFLMLIDNARKSQHMATKPLPIFSRWTLSVITASQPARQPSSAGFKKNHRAGTTNPLTILNYNDVHACPFLHEIFPPFITKHTLIQSHVFPPIISPPFHSLLINSKRTIQLFLEMNPLQMASKKAWRGHTCRRYSGCNG